MCLARFHEINVMFVLMDHTVGFRTHLVSIVTYLRIFSSTTLTSIRIHLNYTKFKLKSASILLWSKCDCRMDTCVELVDSHEQLSKLELQLKIEFVFAGFNAVLP